MSDIFSEKIILLFICTKIFFNVLVYKFYISQKKILLIDTSIEEFYPVHKNVTYNSLFLYPSAEGIFLYIKTYSLIWMTKKKNLFFIGLTAEVQWIALFIKIATNAVDLAGILLPRLVWSISFWEQCSRAPPLFPPLLSCAN